MHSWKAAAENYRAIAELGRWIEQQPGCNFVQAVFRAERAMSNLDSRDRTKRALKWTHTRLQNRLCRRSQLRFIPWWGGEEDVGIAPHIHALVELPATVDLDCLEYFANRYWRSRLAAAHGRKVMSTVKLRHLSDTSADAKLYFSRYEGPTFSWGTEKVIYECTYLSPALTGISRPVFTPLT
jgi:hypothetical protein